MELALKPTVHLLLVVINKRIQQHLNYMCHHEHTLCWP